MGRIVVPGLPDYRITSDDKLWAARAAQFEGGHDPVDVLWTWTQRFALPNFRRRYTRLYELIQAHSQPVNPIWRRDGSKCRPGGQYAGTDHCTSSKLTRRDRAATIGFSELDADVQAAVNAWASGQAPNPVPKSVDFAAPSVARSFLGRNAGSRLMKQAGNWFIATGTSLAWPDDHVRIEGSPLDVAPIAGIAIAAVGVTALAGAGYYYWSSR